MQEFCGMIMTIMSQPCLIVKYSFKGVIMVVLWHSESRHCFSLVV